MPPGSAFHVANVILTLKEMDFVLVEVPTAFEVMRERLASSIAFSRELLAFIAGLLDTLQK